MSGVLSFGGAALRGSFRGGAAVTEFTRSWTLDAESQDQQGGKPATLVKGPGLGSLSFGGRVVRPLGGSPEKTAERFGALAEAGTPYPLSFGGRVIGANRWLLREVSLTDAVFDGRGRMAAATIELSFEEYVAEGKASASPGTGSSPGVGGSGGIVLTDTYGVGSDAETKAELKRQVEQLALSGKMTR